MNTNFFPAAVVMAFLFCSVLLPAATTTGEPCADLSTAFDDRLEAELDSFEDWLTPPSPTDKQVQNVESQMANLKRRLCEWLTNKEIEGTQAVKGLRVFRTKYWLCRTDPGEAEVSNIGGFLALFQHSATSFCNELAQLEKRHGEPMVYFSADAIKAYERFQEEFVCAQQDLVKLPQQLFIPYFSAHIADFPPYVQVLSELESICEQLKSKDIELDDAWRQVQRAMVRLGGGPALAFALVHHIMTKIFGILAWPALLAALLSTLTFAVCLPLYIVFSTLGWLDSTRSDIWHDWQERFGWGIGISFIVFIVLGSVAYIDSVVSLVTFVAVLIGIVGSVIGALVGLKKLAGK